MAEGEIKFKRESINRTEMSPDTSGVLLGGILAGGLAGYGLHEFGEWWNDTDRDGVSNAIEDKFGTSKDKADTDGDGYLDSSEIIQVQTSTKDAAGNVVLGAPEWVAINSDDVGKIDALDPTAHPTP